MGAENKRRIPSLWMYPVARLTVAMGLGVVATDWFLGGPNGVCLGDKLVVVEWVLGVVLLLLYGFLLAVYSLNSFRIRGCFGGLTMLAFFVWGGLRLMQERTAIDWVWEVHEGVYLAKVMDAPVVKGKVFQTEVWIEGELQRATPDSLQRVAGSQRLEGVEGGDAWLPVQRRILLYAMPDSLQRPLVRGDWLVFAGKVTRPVSEVELTGFDYASFLYRKGVSGTAMVFRGDWMLWNGKRRLEDGLRERALRCRDSIMGCYRKWNLGEEELAVVAALTVGDKSVLTSSLKESYSAAGVSHVLALSGLHVGILSAVLYALLFPLRRFRWGRKLQSFVVVVFLWGFAFITGLSPSVVRAVTMCSVYFMASCVLEERFVGVYTLVLAAFLMLCVQPMYVFDVSFQLSFLAVASILYFYPVVVNWKFMKRCVEGCPKVTRRLADWVWRGVAVSVSAQLGTLPLILYYFGTFPTYFLVANLVVGVFAVCVLCGTLVALLVSEVPWLGMVSIAFVDRVTWAMNASMLWVQQLSGAQLQSLSISVWQSCCGFVFLISLYLFVRSRRVIPLIGMLASFNASLMDWNIQGIQSFEASSPSFVYLYRSQLYLKQQQQLLKLTSANQLYVIDTLRIGILKDDRWRWKEASPLIEVDYLYIGRGFKGSLEDLKHVFRFNQLVLDVSLSSYYLNKLIEACQQQQITYAWSTPQRAYAIPLSSLTE